MEKYKKYFGVLVFAIAALALVLVAYYIVEPQLSNLTTSEGSLTEKKATLETKIQEQKRVEEKLQKLKDSIDTAPKKVYAPTENDLGKDTIFFTMYNDLLEVIHANAVKIKSLDYSYNPSDDKFVEAQKEVYLVCDINMELVSNYVNIGKLVQDIYQYPYYIKLNNLSIKPYEKDKKILVANLSIRLYAHTTPQEEIGSEEKDNENLDAE